MTVRSGTGRTEHFCAPRRFFSYSHASLSNENLTARQEMDSSIWNSSGIPLYTKGVSYP